MVDEWSIALLEVKMNVAVVYHSKWGNCERIAGAIGRSLSEAGQDVTVLSVDSAGDLPVADLLVLGSPTRAGRSSGPVKKFIKRKLSAEWNGKPFAAFGTGMKDRGEKMEPKSADDIYTRLEAGGLKPIAPAFKAWVSTWKGPLEEGEAERAFNFGKDLADALEKGQ
jgi:menaquinone-dependent protoporphyrinogen IX oxidase